MDDGDRRRARPRRPRHPARNAAASPTAGGAVVPSAAPTGAPVATKTATGKSWVIRVEFKLFGIEYKAACISMCLCVAEPVVCLTPSMASIGIRRDRTTRHPGPDGDASLTVTLSLTLNLNRALILALALNLNLHLILIQGLLATRAGTVCGPNGHDACQPEDINLWTESSRRTDGTEDKCFRFPNGICVTYIGLSLTTHRVSAARERMVEYATSGEFALALKDRGGALSQVTSAVVCCCCCCWCVRRGV